MSNDYFDEDDVEDQDEQEDTEATEYDTLKDIKEVRRKFKIELDVKIPEIDKRLNLINFDLFGDPMHSDIPGKLTDVEDELENPILARHPIADKSRVMIKQIKNLQIEYRNAHRMYKAYLTEYDNLILNLVRMAEIEIAEKKGRAIPEDVVVEGLGKAQFDKWVTKENADIFMQQVGAPPLGKYNEGVQKRNYDMCFKARRRLNDIASGYFPRHPDPERLSTQLLSEYGNATWDDAKEYKRDSMRAQRAALKELREQKKRAQGGNTSDSDEIPPEKKISEPNEPENQPEQGQSEPKASLEND